VILNRPISCNLAASFGSNGCPFVIKGELRRTAKDGEENLFPENPAAGVAWYGKCSSCQRQIEAKAKFQSSTNLVRTMTMPTVGLSMIVKNGAQTLRPCLESVLGIVSQIVIGDTGSTDDTVKIAHEFGARVIPVAWENHFAKARNAALAPMTTDWVLVLDADEELDANAKAALPELLAAPNLGGYMITIRDYMPERTSYFLEHAAKPNFFPPERAKAALSYHDQHNIRLFRRNPGVYFYGRVHELVEYRISLLGLKYVPADILIHHYGHLRGNEVRGAKALFYRNLGQLKVQEDKDNPFAWFELGILEYKTFQNLDVALPCFQQTVKLHPPFTRAWLFMAMIHLEKGQPFEALIALEQAEAREEAAGFRERLKGDAYYNLGQVTQARTAYQNALKLGENDPVVESRLGLTEVRMGETQAGFARLQQAVNDAPHHAELHDRLVKACLVAEDLPGAAEAAERFAGCLGHPKTFLRAASIRAQLKQWEQSQNLLQRALQLFPGSAELQNACAEVERQRVAAIGQPNRYSNQAGG
jgi:glycosyltransferase involved in cell wall biosynthesis